MAILFSPLYKEINTINGSINLEAGYFRGFLKHIIIKAETESTVFDVALSDGSSLDILSRESVDGELNELIELPVTSDLLVKINNATRDERFKIYFLVHELG